MDVFFSGAWRTPGRGELLIGGAWRRITRGEVYRSGAWHPCAAFIPPMTVSAPPVVTGYRSGPKPIAGVVNSGIATATPNGGQAPYRYTWSIDNGLITISNPTMASTYFSSNVPASQEREGTATVTCTDALGTVALASVQVSLINESGG